MELDRVTRVQKEEFRKKNMHFRPGPVGGRSKSSISNGFSGFLLKAGVCLTPGFNKLGLVFFSSNYWHSAIISALKVFLLHLNAASWERRDNAAKSTKGCMYVCLYSMYVCMYGWKHAPLAVLETRSSHGLVILRFPKQTLCYLLHTDLRAIRSRTPKKQDAISPNCT